MFNFLTLLILLLFQPSQCDWYESSATHHHYYFSNEEYTWSDARELCTDDYNGYLATIDSLSEFRFIRYDTYTGSNGHWIGLHRTCGSCNWRWVEDNSEVSFSRWDDDYPKPSSDRKYVIFNFEHNRWRNIESRERRRFICEVPDGCYPSNPCLNGGRCSFSASSPDHFSCRCSGFTGSICEEDVDECSRGYYPCHYGNCTNTPGSYDCDCFTGFTGQTCYYDIDECAENTHQCITSNGQCIDMTGSYRCECFPGFTGTYCESDINECESHDCIHGNCVDLNNAYTCDCSGSGYAGEFCESDINECEENSHQCDSRNSRDCVNTEGNYECECLPGYTGQYCQTDINECVSNPCERGSCINYINRYTCDCHGTGYSGIHCTLEIDECHGNMHQCVNGECRNTPGSYECTCDAGYMGNYCDLDIDECASNGGCNNHGNCTNTIGSFNCTCEESYSGIQCEISLLPRTKERQKGQEKQFFTPSRIGIAVAGVVVIAIVVIAIAVVLYRKRRAQRVERRERYALPEQPAQTSNPTYNELIHADKNENKHKQKPKRETITEDIYETISIESLNGPQDDFNWDILADRSTIWSGKYAVIYKGVYKNQKCAVKTLAAKDLKNRKIDMEWFRSQIEAMRLVIDHPNIAKLISFSTSAENMAMVTQFEDFGDLKNYLSMRFGNSLYMNTRDASTYENAPDKATIMRHLTFGMQIVEGITHLRSVSQMDILHFELSARHILVGKDQVCKITNFGSAEQVRNRQKMRKKNQDLSSVPWMAPECITNAKQHSTASDVWSYGVLLYEIATNGDDPYPTLKTEDIPQFVVKGKIMKAPSFSDHLSGLMKESWSYKPHKRPNWETLKLKLKKQFDKNVQLYENAS